jgi:hypothetical protein
MQVLMGEELGEEELLDRLPVVRDSVGLCEVDLAESWEPCSELMDDEPRFWVRPRSLVLVPSLLDMKRL